MAGVDIVAQLNSYKEKNDREADQVLQEVSRILNKDLYSEKNVLNNLRNYNRLAELVDEDEVEPQYIYRLSDIRAIAIKYRLRFADSQRYKFDFPFEAVLKIDELNEEHHKTLRGFKILTTRKRFVKENSRDVALLFAPTSNGNYYLVHAWGRELPWHRGISSWPMRTIETLMLTVFMFTLMITLLLPTELITLDRKATYWCGWRLGVFFHLLIFNSGFTTYLTFAFGRNLSSAIWNSDSDLG